MFRPARCLRRSIHTTVHPPPSRSQFRVYLAAGGAVAATITALALTSGSAPQPRRIALDSSQSLSAPTRKNITHSPRIQSPTVADTVPSPEVGSEASDASQSTLPEDNQQLDSQENKGAYDPVTGEINWDCPCLGGMAHGACGQEFREAFSCFVFSEEEPKGINCVEKFQGMQTCFRAHPEVYGEELEDDEDADKPQSAEAGLTATSPEISKAESVAHSVVPDEAASPAPPHSSSVESS